MDLPNLQSALLETYRKKRQKITCAESCTAGMVAAALTDLPGSSEIFDRGFVTYSNAAKLEMLGVLETTLDQHGAVSEQVAREMALGALQRSDADISIAVTGIAGPVVPTLSQRDACVLRAHKKTAHARVLPKNWTTRPKKCAFNEP